MIWLRKRSALGSTLSCTLALAPPLGEPPPPRLTAPLPARPAEAVDAAPDRCQANGRDVCRPMTIGGAVLMGLGVTALGSGIGLAAVGDRHIEGQGAYLRSYRPAGVLLIGVAVLVVTAGAFLVRESVLRRRGANGRRSWRVR